MDLSQLSTEDLMALKGGDLSKVSTQGLQSLKQISAHTAAAADTAAWQQTINPTDGMSTLDKLNAGIGKAFSDVGTGVQQLGAATADLVDPRHLSLSNLITGQKPQSRVDQLRAQVAQDRVRDAPLMSTGAGKVGDILGNVALVAPTVMIPGANTVTGGALIGAASGLLQPSASTRETLTNVGVGGAVGGAGQALSNWAARGVAAQQARNAATVAQNAQKTQAAQGASQAGYVIPPADIGQGGGIVTDILQGVGGKIKTAQVASERNQAVTNRLAKQALGMAPDDPLTVQGLAAIRNQAAQTGYAPIRGAGQVATDPQFTQALNQIAGASQGAGRSFPGLQNNGVVDLVNSLRQPHFDAGDAIDATRVLRDRADAAFAQGDATVGRAARQAADAIEGQLERHLQAAGNPDALQAFRDARRQIAQTYSVQSGLNTTTGDVAANALARQLQRGRPLTGNLLEIAQAAQAFPKATQALKESPKALSPLDMALAVLQKDPMGLVTLGARPAARSIMLSPAMQQSAIQAAGTPQNANALLRALAQEQLTLPATLGSTNALASYLTQQQ